MTSGQSVGEVQPHAEGVAVSTNPSPHPPRMPTPVGSVEHTSEVSLIVDLQAQIGAR